MTCTKQHTINTHLHHFLIITIRVFIFRLKCCLCVRFVNTIIQWKRSILVGFIMQTCKQLNYKIFIKNKSIILTQTGNTTHNANLWRQINPCSSLLISSNLRLLKLTRSLNLSANKRSRRCYRWLNKRVALLDNNGITSSFHCIRCHNGIRSRLQGWLLSQLRPIRTWHRLTPRHCSHGWCAS